jgi:hypothetical protein
LKTNFNGYPLIQWAKLEQFWSYLLTSWPLRIKNFTSSKTHLRSSKTRLIMDAVPSDILEVSPGVNPVSIRNCLISMLISSSVAHWISG